MFWRCKDQFVFGHNTFELFVMERQQFHHAQSCQVLKFLNPRILSIFSPSFLTFMKMLPSFGRGFPKKGIVRDLKYYQIYGYCGISEKIH